LKSYIDCWIGTATALFAQALAGEPQLAESLPKPLPPGSFGFAANLTGDVSGRFAVMLDGAILESPMMGEGIDQQAGWAELLREVAEAAAGDLLATTGKKSRVGIFEATPGESNISRAFQLKAGGKSWTVLVRDETRDESRDNVPDEAGEQVLNQARAPLPAAASDSLHSEPPPPGFKAAVHGQRSDPDTSPGTNHDSGLRPGVQLLLDVELDASLRFGCREMPLGEILDLGPGDVVQLDRHISDPVDLIVGDKIVARGEVVLINGNFALRVIEVAAPRHRLESIRCLF
jgi:flagellar motor switch protein FliN/FliY